MTTPGPVLRDIHLPGEPSWWPPAPGWWILAALLALALAYALRRHAQHRARRRQRDALQAELARVQADAADGAAQVAALSLLLRRAAKRYAPAALSLRDDAWLRFLDADDDSRPFSRGAGRLLLDGPYRAHIDAAEAQALSDLVKARLPGFIAAKPGARRD